MFWRCPKCKASREKYALNCEHCGSFEPPEFANSHAILAVVVLGGLGIYYLVVGEFPDFGGVFEGIKGFMDDFEKFG